MPSNANRLDRLHNISSTVFFGAEKSMNSIVLFVLSPPGPQMPVSKSQIMLFFLSIPIPLFVSYYWTNQRQYFPVPTLE